MAPVLGIEMLIARRDQHNVRHLKSLLRFILRCSFYLRPSIGEGMTIGGPEKKIGRKPPWSNLHVPAFACD